MTRSLEQQRAAHAHTAAKAAAGDKSIREAYKQRVKSLPAEVITNGLGQALAMLRKDATESDGIKALQNDLQGWLKAYPASPFNQEGDLLDTLVTGDQAFYVWAQEESLLYLNWLKPLAQAYCGTEGNDGAKR